MDRYQFSIGGVQFIVDYGLESITLKSAPQNSLQFSDMEQLSDGELIFGYEPASQEFFNAILYPLRFQSSFLIGIPAEPFRAMSIYYIAPGDSSKVKERMRSVGQPTPKADIKGKIPGKGKAM